MDYVFWDIWVYNARYLPQILINNRIIFTEAKMLWQIKAVIDRAVARFKKTAPVNTHQLSCDCYALLLTFSNGFFHANTSDPLWEKYVEPVLRLIETHYMEDLTAESYAGRSLCIPAIWGRNKTIIKLIRPVLFASERKRIIRYTPSSVAKYRSKNHLERRLSDTFYPPDALSKEYRLQNAENSAENALTNLRKNPCWFQPVLPI